MAEIYDSLAGQAALVTGATRGIGAEIADRLVDLDATVYAGARDTGDIAADDRRPIELDVTAEAEIRAAVDRIADEAGALDVLVNNAGIYGPSGQFGELDPAELRETLAVDLHGPLLLCRYALPQMAEGGRIVNVSSAAGQFDRGISDSNVPYGVSKAGLNAFTDAVARQYPDLFANAVNPGWVRTDMGGPEAPRSVPEGAETPVWLARFRDGPSGAFWYDRERIEW